MPAPLRNLLILLAIGLAAFFIAAFFRAMEINREAAIGTALPAALQDDMARLLASDPPSIGPADARFTIIEFIDYQCGWCKKASGDILALARGNDDVRLVWIEYPVLGEMSRRVARLALAADMQGRYTEFHETLMGWRGPLNDETLPALMREAGVDYALAKRIAGRDDVARRLNMGARLAQSAGIRGTPGFIFEDRVLRGAIPPDQMQAVLDHLRSREPS